MNKDYYQILGIKKSSSEAEVKKAYKKLAMQWHPDRHQWDKKAEEKFKEINEAYQVLGDKEKKKKYDTYGTADFEDMRSGNPGWDFSGFDFGDIFSQWWRATRWWNAHSFEFDLWDIMSSFWWQSRSRTSDVAEESLDTEQIVELPLIDFLVGTKISVDSPYSWRFKVTVPECTKPWTRLKVTGKGHTRGKKVGNLYLKLDTKMPKKLTENQKEILEKILR